MTIKNVMQKTFYAIKCDDNLICFGFSGKVAIYCNDGLEKIWKNRTRVVYMSLKLSVFQ